MKYVAQRKVHIKWSDNFAYAIGLIASDGCLSKDGRHIYFTSKDKHLVENLKNALRIKNKIFKHYRGDEKIKKYYAINFSDVIFYKFLNKIGLTSSKSKTIERVVVPHKYFDGFTRGLFDGDGTFYTFNDKRWPNGFGYKTSFASASTSFIHWLKESFTIFYGVNGYLHKGDGVTNLEYTKNDSRKLFRFMYHQSDVLFLKRKYDKMKIALEYDAKLHPNR